MVDADIDVDTKTKLWPEVRVICVYNFKGGVAKTTTTHSLIDSIKIERKIMVFDLDSQCNLTSLLNENIKRIMERIEEDKGEEDEDIDEELIREPDNNVYKLWLKAVEQGTGFMEEASGSQKDVIKTILKIKEKNGYSFVPGTRKLYNIESWLNRRQETLRDRFALVNIILRLAVRSGYDSVLIDMNPGDSLLNRTLLHRADFIVTPTFLDHSSICSTYDFICQNTRDINKIGKTVTERYDDEMPKPLVCVTKYKKSLWDNVWKLNRAHKPWIKILNKFCLGKAGCMLLCEQLEADAQRAKGFNSIYEIESAGSETQKIDLYKVYVDDVVKMIFDDDTDVTRLSIDVKVCTNVVKDISDDEEDED
jgi:cellulose biosynthesis protein BcsQ